MLRRPGRPLPACCPECGLDRGTRQAGRQDRQTPSRAHDSHDESITAHFHRVWTWPLHFHGTLWLEDPAPRGVERRDLGAGWPGFELQLSGLGKALNGSVPGFAALSSGGGGAAVPRVW